MDKAQWAVCVKAGPGGMRFCAGLFFGRVGFHGGADFAKQPAGAPRMRGMTMRRIVFLSGLAFAAAFSVAVRASGAEAAAARARYNVLLIMSDDLTATALSCYGNGVCQTPNIDRLAERGMRFTHAYCQGTYCGPSRASFMSGYYPHATGELGYRNPRPRIGERAMWPEHFKMAGCYTARVSKIFHMGVPGDIERGDNGADDARCWTERFNSKGPEWKAPGDGETLERNLDGKKPVMGGNTLVVVEADGGDLAHSDGRTAAKACELIEKHKGERFWLGVGFVRPHVPFVAPAEYFDPFKPYEKMNLPEQVPGDWDDIPKAGINYKTNKNMQLDIRRQKKALGGYYGAVRYMDSQVGKVLDALEKAGVAEETIVIFTTDHGYHLDEHGFWEKVSLHEESARVPLIICVPGKKPAVCDSLVELLDLFPTTASLCGLGVPGRLQGEDLSPLFDDPSREVRDAAFDVSPRKRGFLLRTKKWAYIQYREDASKGIELFDMETDPKQYTNLAKNPKYADVVARFKKMMAAKLREVRANDLEKKG
jgi:iduronate 2-sulfatase